MREQPPCPTPDADGAPAPPLAAPTSSAPRADTGPAATPGRARQALLLCGADEDEPVWRDLVAGQPEVALIRVTDDGSGPFGLPPQLDRVVLVADCRSVTRDPAAVSRWRRALATIPAAIFLSGSPEEITEALDGAATEDVDDFLERPHRPAHLVRKIRTAFRRLTEQQGREGLRAELTEQATDFQEFRKVALALAAEGDVNRLLELIVTKSREVTCADAGSLYLIESESTPPETPAPGAPILRFVVAQNDSRPLNVTTIRLPLNRASIAGYVALTRTPLNLPDVHRLPPGAEFSFNPEVDQALGYRTVSMLTSPLIDPEGQVIGVLQVINRKRAAQVRLDTPERAIAEARPFEPRDQEMVTSLASLAAVVTVKGRRAEEARRELENQLRQAQKMEAVGRLAGGIAHDFNNMLMVITGRCELLLRRLGAEDPVRPPIELIRRTGLRAAALTQQLLAFSRRQLLHPLVLDLNALVASMQPLVGRVLGEDVELEIVLQPDLGATRADPTQLEQVIMNLVMNARDAMPRGGRLTLQTANVELDERFVRGHAGARVDSYVTLAVRDTGAGMDETALAHVFEPFFTTKGLGKGAGLGLATAYGIVEQHHGCITVDSKPGRGTTFSVYLPRVRDAEPAVDPAPTSVEPSGGHGTILLVEDEQAVRTVVREILQAAGYTVLEAEHGAHALQVAARHTGDIDLLLTDVVMPYMNGRALATQLAAARPGLKVLFISGYTNDAVVDHGVLDPGVVLIQKPFSSAALLRRVRAVLDQG